MTLSPPVALRAPHRSFHGGRRQCLCNAQVPSAFAHLLLCRFNNRLQRRIGSHWGQPRLRVVELTRRDEGTDEKKPAEDVIAAELIHKATHDRREGFEVLFGEENAAVCDEQLQVARRLTERLLDGG